jgi:hypothetical protein
MISLGSRPWFEVSSRFDALKADSASSSSPPAGSSRRLFTSAPLTWSGVQEGCSSSSVATTPATTGADIDVPPARMYWPSPDTQSGHIDAKSLSGARLETIRAPGAYSSGFA